MGATPSVVKEVPDLFEMRGYRPVCRPRVGGRPVSAGVLTKPLPPALIPVSAVAQRFQVSERTVRRWVAEGKLRAFRAGKIIRVYADSVNEAIARGGLVTPRRIGRGA